MPAFLKNSLFYFGENFDKYRQMEVGYKFFVVDELREKGNMDYIKGKFPEALSQYEKAASILRWLECIPDEFVQKLKDLPRCPNPEAEGEDGEWEFHVLVMGKLFGRKLPAFIEEPGIDDEA